MYNLLVRGAGWSGGRDSMGLDRVFEHTDSEVAARFRAESRVVFRDLIALPALFMEESSGGTDPAAYVGTVSRAAPGGRDVALTYSYDPDIPPLLNSRLKELASELDIADFEFTRTHWAVKDVDLFHVLLRHQHPTRQRPRVFQLSDPERVEPTLVSAMMPFHPAFDPVYQALKESAATAGLRCRRADDIWENPAVIQDVVSLIDRSRIVICDCTHRNPNVFYEIGIAHTLGREVILISQAEADIPFDLRHLRYLRYLNNGEGLADLRRRLDPRLAALA